MSDERLPEGSKSPNTSRPNDRFSHIMGFGNVINGIVRGLGISQRKVAIAMEVDEALLGRILKGERNPPKDPKIPNLVQRLGLGKLDEAMLKVSRDAPRWIYPEEYDLLDRSKVGEGGTKEVGFSLYIDVEVLPEIDDKDKGIMMEMLNEVINENLGRR